MLDYMNEGGSIMWAIAALSAAALAVTIERLMFFRKASGDAENLERVFASAVSGGHGRGELQSSPASLSRLFSDALSQWEAGREDMKLLTEESVRREIYRWERHLFVLEIVGKLAPMLGLLGTVLGMVEMFGSLHMGGQISAEAVTGGIWKALYTTVAGLSVAIPVIFVNGLLNSRIDGEEEKLRRGADWVMRLHRKRGA
ncbi:MotA/TolQ/ExbB proton channel family protein [Cloacibacillus sp. An23]|uniref:MotA/TolQ/ExbB proton channel family protein n=1 Tax=Cloacibacillus sp. An23 TaxID=1965591 RepID=UPI000B37748F|nr:MotA/TolQ/ExbB proton channel family protein [Cloacibacillus sp. An23]OUO93279.1 flagellar motor protein MotA [Cloacibacillus sp. An23]